MRFRISGFGGGLGQLSGDCGGAGVPRLLVGKVFQASFFKAGEKCVFGTVVRFLRNVMFPTPFFTSFLLPQSASTFGAGTVANSQERRFIFTLFGDLREYHPTKRGRI